MKTQKKSVQKLPIGISGFRKLRQRNYHYIDKTLFVREVLDAPEEVLLIPRPRRFGKTLNLSMLRYFFEKSEQDRTSLFDGLAIRDDDCFDEHQGKYPVIWLTFKDVKARNWDNLYKGLRNLISREIERHSHSLKREGITATARNFLESVADGRASERDYEETLLILSEQLRRLHGEPVVILIDEYDTPIHAGHTYGYYDDVISFMRNFLSAGLKDNPHLFKGVLTGILRVAKESIFSGLNNPGVYTLLDREFNAAFGFTEDEVTELLADYGLSESFDEVSHWYNGYLFGKRVIYNPWSVLNYISRKEDKARPWWVNTADTGIIENLATRGGRELREELGCLIEGGGIRKPVYDSIVMRDLDTQDDLVWSLLLFSGYLKSVGPAERRKFRKLEIPNEEVRIAYEDMIERWFADKIRPNRLEEMLAALETGDVKQFERSLRLIVTRIMSYHDLAGEPEKVYHALVLGMLVWLSHTYHIRSNRESGLGRYDLMLRPKDPGKQGIIIEFKRLEDEEEKDGEKKKKKKKTPEDAVREALRQIAEKGYTEELEAAGIRKILRLAIVFRGKELWVGQEETGV